MSGFKKSLFEIAIAFSFAVGLAPVAQGRPDNIPTGRTGAPFETTCSFCHTPPDPQRRGALRLTFDPGLDGGYVTRGEYMITVELPAGYARWGFQVTVLDQEGKKAGQLIGDNLEPVERRFTDVSPKATYYVDSQNQAQRIQPDRQYINHTRMGNTRRSWTFKWIAPGQGDRVDRITFYAAGIAADGRQGEAGDYTFTNTRSANRKPAGQLLPFAGAEAILPEKLTLLQSYPNPFNPETWLPYRLATDADVSIRIYNANGKLVRTLGLGNQKAGVYVTKESAAYWDGRDEHGEQVAGGVYFYTLQAGQLTATRRMVLMK